MAAEGEKNKLLLNARETIMHDRIRVYALSAIAAPLIFLAAQAATTAFAQAAPATQSAAQARRQAQQLPAAAAPVPMSDQELAATQGQLLQLLRTSPTLTTVVAHDPTLLSDQEYVSRNNPQLAQFLLQHPDVARNPEYYLFTHLEHGKGRRDQALERAVWPDMVPLDRSRSPAMQLTHEMVPIIIVPALFLAWVWIIKLMVESLRWNRAFRQQNEIHSRLIEKFGNSQDLAAYMDTEAGKRFLTGAPIALGPDIDHRMPNAVARVLTPLQVGVVMVLLGIGFLLLRNAGPDMVTPMVVLGTVVLMPGIGFILSAGIAWILASRLGLIPPKSAQPAEATHGRQ